MVAFAEFVPLFAVVLLAALAVVVHFALVRRAYADVTEHWARMLLCVPPCTPFIAWRAGHRRVAVLWGIVLASYALVRVLFF